MADPVGWGSALTTRYGPTMAGLIIGTAAKYGLTLTEGRKLTWRGVIADLLLLGMLGLIAIAITEWFALTGNARVLAGALAAVSSDRLVRLARDRFLRRLDGDGELGSAIRSAEAMAHVKAGHLPATTATVTVFKNADPRTAGLEMLADELMPKRPNANLNGLIGDIDRSTKD